MSRKLSSDKNGLCVQVFCSFSEMRDPAGLVPNPRNPNTHSPAQVELLARVIKAHGWRAPITVSKRSGFVVRGHGRLMAALKLGCKTVPVDVQDYASEALEYADLIADNRLAELSEIDPVALKDLIKDIDLAGYDVGLTGYEQIDLDKLTANMPYEGDLLVKRYIVPPFSVLNARLGYWKERKKKWIDMGISSGEGRDVGAYQSDSRTDTTQKIMCISAGRSIFDPVLTEIMYTWYCPPDGSILDPFAGGSVRGIVAHKLGYHYTGIDLSEKQIKANMQQADAIIKDNPPSWTVGDSRNIKTLAPGDYDFIFSCPPYYDLEVYSDDAADISNTGTYDDFIKAYRSIITDSLSMLRPDRFACFVVGDIRDSKGFYRNFVSDTITAFEDGGAMLYNDAILITQVGKVCLLINKSFNSYRKLGKVHQNVLIFYKGNPTHIKDNFPELDLNDVSDMMETGAVIDG